MDQRENKKENYQQRSKPYNRRKTTIDTSMIYGKVPPQATELEKAILGAIMQFNQAFDTAAELLTYEVFYMESHQRIYKAMMSLAQKSQPIDMLTVTEQLRATEELDLVGGPFYISALTNSVSSPASIEHYCRIVVQKFIQREVIRVGGDMIKEAYEDSTDAFELLDQVETNILSVRQGNFKKQFMRLDSVLVKVIQELEDLRDRDEHLTGVTSGFKDLDYVTGGWQGTDMIVLAARPSVGKTAFALNLARNATLGQKPVGVGIFSLEMKAKKLAHRLLSSESEVWIWNLTNARLDNDKMKQLYSGGVQKLARADIYIDDTTSLNVVEFRAKARRMVHKHGVGLIIIDYLQLMTAPGHIQNREQQVSFISREVKATASELDIPIIALSQLNRDIDKTKGREPLLSDMRESGAIEQDADLVMFLWRPSDEEVLADASLTEMCFAGIKKHRSGALAKFMGQFKKEIQRWNNLKVVDERTLMPIGSNWKPVAIQQPNLFIESKKSGEEEMPF